MSENSQSDLRRSIRMAAMILAAMTLVGGLIVTLLIVARPERIGPLIVIGLLVVQGLFGLFLWQNWRAQESQRSQTQTYLVALERARAEQSRLQDELGRYQAAQQRTAALARALAAPIIPITRGVVAVPLVGELDAQHIQNLHEYLLRGIEQQHARVVILDLTGVTALPDEGIRPLMQAVLAADLMGCQVILTGIGATIARTLLNQPGELRAVTRRDLQAGIAYAGELLDSAGKRV